MTANSRVGWMCCLVTTIVITLLFVGGMMCYLKKELWGMTSH